MFLHYTFRFANRLAAAADVCQVCVVNAHVLSSWLRSIVFLGNFMACMHIGTEVVSDQVHGPDLSARQ